MIQIFPELFDLVLRGKLFFLHIPQNLRNLLLNDANVRISKNFDDGLIKFVLSETEKKERKI
jgi:hypothetical protein